MQRVQVSDKKDWELHVDVEVVSTDPLLDIRFKSVEKLLFKCRIPRMQQ